MFGVLMLLFGNWVSLWDFHTMETMSLPVILGGFALSIMQYFICALVSPDFEDGETYDMRAFHEREGRTYIAAIIVLGVFALAVNYAAGASLGVESWSDQNTMVAIMLPCLLLPLFVKAHWAQLLGAIAFAANVTLFLVLYYPVLR